MGHSFYVSDIEAWENKLGEVRRLEEEPRTETVDNAVILPLRYIEGSEKRKADWLLEGGVCLADGTFIAGQNREYLGGECNRGCAQGYEFDVDKVLYRDETVIYGGILAEHWGHMLVDSAARLWYPIREEALEYKTVFLMTPGYEFKFKNLLDMAGMTEDRYEILTEATQFSRVIIPEETMYSYNGVYNRHWLDFFDRVRDSVEPAEYEKIYLTRTALSTSNVIGKVVGEEYFEKYFAEKGYKVIAPEQYSIAEQVSFLAGAREIVTTGGTLSHLALFAHNGISLFTINRIDSTTRMQFAIDQARELDAFYVDAQKNFLPETPALSTWLMAPTKYWNEFIRDKFEDNEDADYEECEFPRYCLEYIKEWASALTSERKFRVIKDENLKTIVERINLVLNNEDVDLSAFDDPKDVIKLKRKNERLEKKIKKMENSKSWKLTAWMRRRKR